MKDFEFLMWLHERLVKVHKENPLADYMHKLRAIILATPSEQETPNVAMANNLDDVKDMLAGTEAPSPAPYNWGVSHAIDEKRLGLDDAGLIDKPAPEAPK